MERDEGRGEFTDMIDSDNYSLTHSTRSLQLSKVLSVGSVSSEFLHLTVIC